MMKILMIILLIASVFGGVYAEAPRNLNSSLSQYFGEFESGKEDTYLILEDIVTKDPDNTQALYLLANDYTIHAINLSNKHQYEDAMIYYDKAIEHIYKVLHTGTYNNDVDCQYLTFMIWVNKVKTANDYMNTHDINRPTPKDVNLYIGKAKYVALYGIVPLLNEQPEDKMVRYFRRGDGVVYQDLATTKRDINNNLNYIESLYIWDGDKEAKQL